MDLDALYTYLESLAQQGPVTLSADDSGLPAEITDFLRAAPGDSITIDPAQAGELSEAADTVTLAGATATIWPIAGLYPAQTSLASATFVFASSGAITLHAEGSLNMSASVSADINLDTDSSTADASWLVTLRDPLSGLTPKQLLEFGQMLSVPYRVPDSLTVLDDPATVATGGLELAFIPGGPGAGRFRFAWSAASSTAWTAIPGVLEFGAMQVGTIQIGSSGVGSGGVGSGGVGSGGAPISASCEISTPLTIGGASVDVGVLLDFQDQWTAFVRPVGGGAFPGLAEIAAWLLDPDAAGVDSSFDALGLDLGGFDLGITMLTATFVGSSATFLSASVYSEMSVLGVDFSLRATFPKLALYGRLKPGETIELTSLMASAGLNVDALPTDLAISAIDLDAEITADDYAMTVEVDDVWDLGPIALDSIVFSLACDASSGALQFGGEFTVDTTIGGVISFGLSAGYDDTRGWFFMGQTLDSISIADLIAAMADSFGVDASTIPAPISSLVLDSAELSYQTGDGKFHFACAGSMTLGDTPIEAKVSFDLGPRAGAAPGYDVRCSGELTIADLVFDLVFDDQDASSQTFIATYSHRGEQTGVSLQQLVAGVSTGLGGLIPASLVIDLKDVILAAYKPSTTWIFAFGFDLAATFSLSDIPLFGDLLPADETVGISDLQYLYASAALTVANVTSLNALLPSGVSKLPAAGVTGGSTITVTLQLGSLTQPMGLGVTPPPPVPAPSTLPPPPPPPKTNGVWVNVQQTFGPITFARIGLTYQDNAIIFELDCSLRTGGLTIDLTGAGVGSPLDDFELVFTLAGLGVDYTRGPFDVGGALLDVPPAADVEFEYDGALIMQLGKFGIATSGSYAQMTDSSASMFVFGQLEGSFGGIPAFWLNGFSVGFGYNRELQLPTASEVLDFPLLGFAAEGGSPPDPAKVLNIMEGRAPGPSGLTRQWITPKQGDDWFAAGLAFTSYELVHSQAMVAGLFGQDIAVALLGVATVRLPQSSGTYAYAQLELDAIWDITGGNLSLGAALSRTSYIFDPSCKLTGAFALDVWYAGDHAGQFVLTFGGYNAQFVAPSYYPLADRVGASWKLSTYIAMDGDVYFALTPSSVMAGGRLDFQLQFSNLKAWFTLISDLLIAWKPFSFQASGTVDVGVSYRMNLLFTTVTISVQLGADIELWGPPTGGEVRVDWDIISFSIPFGTSKSDADDDAPLAWTDFATLLPASDAILQIQALRGLTGQLDSGEWVVRNNGFAFQTHSAIPANALTANGVDAPVDSFSVDIRPMNLRAVSSTHALTIAGVDSLSGWTITPIQLDVPTSLWGAPLTNASGDFVQQPSTPSSETVPGAPLGLVVEPPPPRLGVEVGPVALSELLYEPVTPVGALPLDAAVVPDEEFTPEVSTTAIADIAAIDTGAAASARADLFATLSASGLYTGPSDSLSRLAAVAPTAYVAQPLERA